MVQDVIFLHPEVYGNNLISDIEKMKTIRIIYVYDKVKP